MTLMRLFAAYARRRGRCWCGEPNLHPRCLSVAFGRFLDDLEASIAPKV